MSTNIRPVVLVIDDEPSVREVLGSMLGSLGYTALLARGGTEGMELLRERLGEVAAALLDVRMPWMDGPATMDALHALDPDLPCVFVSGETGSHTWAALMARGALSVLGKPVSIAQLGQSLTLACAEAGEMGARKLFFSADESRSQTDTR